MKHRKFRTWLKDQIKRNDPVGDFAVDAFRDSNHPDFNTKEEWYSYLRSQNACKGALDALKAAWKEFEKQL